MTSPRFRRSRANHPVFDGDFPDTDRDITETLAAVQPGDWDGTTYQPGAGGNANLYALPAPVTAAGPGQDTQPIARLRAQPRYSPPPPQPPPVAQQDPRDTGPQQRLPRMSRTAARPRPQRPSDCAIFAWSDLIGQHIMKCGVCLRSRYADPIAAHMPFTFEALRVSAHVSGWRLDAFTRWACPACQLTPAYHTPRPVILWDPAGAEARLAGHGCGPGCDTRALARIGRVWSGDEKDGCGHAEQWHRAAAEHDLIRDVAENSGHGRHRAGAR